jgi:HEAT repeat protein
MADEFEWLLHKLHGTTPETVEACLSLGAMGDARAVGPLTSALLGRYGVHAETAEAFRTFWEEVELRRAAAARALGWIGGPLAAEVLVAAVVADKEPAAAIQEALAGLAGGRLTEALVGALAGEEDALREVAALVGEGDQTIVRGLVMAVEQCNAAQTPGPAGLLRRIGDRAVDALIARLHEADRLARLNLLEALGATGDPRAVGPLLEALANSDWEVESPAVRALGRTGDPRAAEPLIAALRHSSQYVRGVAAEALGDLGDRRAVEPLISALQDEDSGIECAAAKALGELGDPRAVAPLTAALRDDRSWVRAAVEEALRRLGQ